MTDASHATPEPRPLRDLLISSAAVRSGWIRSPEEGTQLCLLDWDLAVTPAEVELELSRLLQEDIFRLVADGYQLDPAARTPVFSLRAGLRRVQELSKSSSASPGEDDVGLKVEPVERVDARRDLELERLRSRDLAKQVLDERQFSKELTRELVELTGRLIEAQRSVVGLTAEVVTLQGGLRDVAADHAELKGDLRRQDRSITHIRLGVRGLYAGVLFLVAAAGAFGALRVTHRPEVLLALSAGPAVAVVAAIGILIGRGRVRFLLGAFAGVASVASAGYPILKHFFH